MHRRQGCRHASWKPSLLVPLRRPEPRAAVHCGGSIGSCRRRARRGYREVGGHGRGVVPWRGVSDVQALFRAPVRGTVLLRLSPTSGGEADAASPIKPNLLVLMRGLKPRAIGYCGGSRRSCPHGTGCRCHWGGNKRARRRRLLVWVPPVWAYIRPGVRDRYLTWRVSWSIHAGRCAARTPPPPAPQRIAIGLLVTVRHSFSPAPGASLPGSARARRFRA